MKNIWLYQGDCLEVMDKLIEQGVKVDMILTDPPYGTTCCKWDTIIPFDEMWKRLNKLTKDDGAMVLFGSEPFSSLLIVSNIENYKYDWIWDKVIPTGHLTTKYRPMAQTENISVFYRKTCIYNKQLIPRTKEEYEKTVKKIQKKKTHISSSELTPKHKELALDELNLDNYLYKNPTTILKFNKFSNECNNRRRLHPTQKPVELLEYLIKTYTNEDEVILDFTMGSGSTGIACLNTNRKFIGIELDEKYFEIAKNRIENHEVIK